MSTRKQVPKARKERGSKSFDYEVTVTAPRARTEVYEVKAPNSATARREAKKALKEEDPSKASKAHFSAKRQE